jgi:hypothetical protein
MKIFIIINFSFLLATIAIAQDSLRDIFSNSKSTQVHQLQLDQTWSCSSGIQKNARPTENKIFTFVSGAYFMNGELVKVGSSSTVLINEKPIMYFRTNKLGDLIIEHVEMKDGSNQKQVTSLSLPKSFIAESYEICPVKNMNRDFPII